MHHAIVFAPADVVCQTVEELLKNGSDPNVRTKNTVDKNTSFQKACNKGNSEVIKLLFKYAKINKIKPDLTKKGKFEHSPLMKILIDDQPSVEIVKLLVEGGADVDEKTDAVGTTLPQYVRESRDASRIYSFYSLFGEHNETWSFPNYPTKEIADYLEAASLKKKLDAGTKKNMLVRELQGIVNDIKKFDKKFWKSFVTLVYFQDNFAKIPQELNCKFIPVNTQYLLFDDSQKEKQKRSKILKPDIEIHFLGKCTCKSCKTLKRKRSEKEQKINKTIISAIGLLDLKK